MTNLLPDNVSLSEQLRIYEYALLEQDGYIEYSPGLAYMN